MYREPGGQVMSRPQELDQESTLWEVGFYD